MSKVYVLAQQDMGKVGEPLKYIGVVTKNSVANKFANQAPEHMWMIYFDIPLELDDPELLNRIAKKESETNANNK